MNAEQPVEAPRHEPPSEAERSSLRRELLAILMLYVAAAIVPLLIGLMFGPTSA